MAPRCSRASPPPVCASSPSRPAATGTPATDFATDEIEQGKLYWLAERLSAGAMPVAFGANNSGTGVGGSMLHWGAYVPRVDPA